MLQGERQVEMPPPWSCANSPQIRNLKWPHWSELRAQQHLWHPARALTYHVCVFCPLPCVVELRCRSLVQEFVYVYIGLFLCCGCNYLDPYRYYIFGRQGGTSRGLFLKYYLLPMFGIFVTFIYIVRTFCKTN